MVTAWNFLTNHGRVLLCIAHDPDVRIRDIAASLGITERRAHGIVTDLTEAGYLIKTKDGRRNRYEIQLHLPIPEATARERAIGEVLDLLGGLAVPGRNIRRSGDVGGRGSAGGILAPADRSGRTGLDGRPHPV
jgi:MarR family